MKKTWMPIIAGAIGIIVGIFQVPFIWFIQAIGELEMGPLGTRTYLVLTAITLFAIFAIVGGICHLFRTKWPLAMAGSTAVFFSFNWFNLHRVISWYYRPSDIYWAHVMLLLLGIAVIILTVLSKKEFK